MLLSSTFYHLCSDSRVKMVLFSVVSVYCGCVCMSVGLFVSVITLDSFEISLCHFYGSKIWSKAEMSSKMAAFQYIGRSRGGVRTYAPSFDDPRSAISGMQVVI